MGNLKRITFWIEPKQAEGLRDLSNVTRIRQGVLMREAVSDLLRKYQKELRKSRERKGG